MHAHTHPQTRTHAQDALLREMRDRLEAAQSAAAAAAAREASDAGELEAARRGATKLRADLARKEAAVRAARDELQQQVMMVWAGARVEAGFYQAKGSRGGCGAGGGHVRTDGNGRYAQRRTHAR